MDEPVEPDPSGAPTTGSSDDDPNDTAGVDAAIDGAPTDDPVETRGCLMIMGLAAVLAVLALIAAVALVVIGKGVFDGSTDSDARRLQEVFIETGISSASTDAAHPPQLDVKLGTCESNGSEGIRASGTLTNWTDRSADYVIEVSFRRSGSNGSGEEFATDTVLVTAVPEHATTNWVATTEVVPDGPFACRIVAINRWPNGSRPAS